MFASLLLLSFSIAALMLVCCSVSPLGAVDFQTEIIYQENFEQDEVGSAPQNVFDDSAWAGGSTKLKVVASGDPKRGKVLECHVSSFGQIAFRDIEVEEGAAYRVSATISSRGIQTVNFMLRRTPDPYRKLGELTTQIYESPQRISFIITSAKDLNPCRVQCIVHANTILILDDILVEKLMGDVPENASGTIKGLLPDPEWPQGNLLANSSFELGLESWYARGKRFALIDDDSAQHGKQVINLINGGIFTPFMQLPLRHPTQLTCWAKAVDKKAKIQLEFGDWRQFKGSSDKGTKELTLDPKDGWQRLSFEWTPQTKPGQLAPWKEFYAGIKAQSGSLLVDAVSIRHLIDTVDPKADYRPRAPLEFALDVDMPHHVAVYGETIAITTIATQADAQCTVRCFDESGIEVRSWQQQLQNGKAVIIIDDLPCGAWRFTTAATASATHDSIQTPAEIAGETMVLVVPEMPNVPIEQWQFGSHIRNQAPLLEACWKLGWRWNRLHDASRYAKWSYLQPDSADQFNFNTEKLALMRQPDYRILGNFDNTPHWVPTTKPHKPGKHTRFNILSDESIPLLEAACEKLGQASPGYIEEIEFTNEISLSGIDPKQYVELLKVAYRGFKAGNPNLKVVGLGGPPNGSHWLFDAIKAGAGQLPACF